MQMLSFKRPYENDPPASASTASSQEMSNHTTFEDTLQKELTDALTTDSPKVKRRRSNSKSKSNSPAPMQARFPTPTSLGGGVAGDTEETSRIVQAVPPSRPAVIDPALFAAIEAFRQSRPPSPVTTVTLPPLVAEILPSEVNTQLPMIPNVDTNMHKKSNTSFSTISSASSVSGLDDPVDTSHEIVRSGTYVLNLLLSNSASKNFVNMVPLTATNYHAIIRHPMDLTTMEQKLWKGYETSQAAAGELSTQALVASTSHLQVSEGYFSLQEFEDDLRLIHNNAVHFNPPDDIIYKEAQMFKTLYTGILSACREHQLLPDYRAPQEIYTPSMISFSEPGPLYLFRAHLVKEMDRKMTDVSVDLFATFHQPLIDTMYGTDDLFPETPRFVRLYINKNRKLLAKCRDEPNAKLAILSDLQASKPFLESSSTSTEGAAQGIRMVRITARVMIVKPIGDRHDMITVGDLDCPSAWIMVACVKRFDLQVDVPAKFEKGVLNKMRHEVVAYGVNSKVSPEHQRVFLDALGVKLPGMSDQKSPQPFAGPTTSLALAGTIASDALLAPTTVASDSSQELSGALANKLASTPVMASIPVSTSPYGLSDLIATSTPSTPPAIKADPEVEEPFLKKPKLEVIEDSILPLSESLSAPDSDASFSVPDESTSSATLILNQVKEEPVPFSTASPILPFTADEMILLSTLGELSQAASSSTTALPELTLEQMKVEPESVKLERSDESSAERLLSTREQEILRDLKLAAEEKHVPYTNWDTIIPTLTMDSAQGLFKRIYHVKGDSGLVVQNFKEMDKESFEQRVREVACLLKLRGLEGVGQIQSVIDDGKDRLVGLSMTK